MPGGRVTIEGLPEGELHVAVFANDNAPGFGAASVTTRTGESANLVIPIIASWSNAHHEPPDALKALVMEFEQGTLAPDVLDALFDALPNNQPIRHYGDMLKALGGADARVRPALQVHRSFP